MIKNSISLVFPMYNEIQYLPLAVEKADTVLKEIATDYEIIIVDDASIDGSGDLAEELSRTNNKIRVIHHVRNRKLGGALKTGFSRATKEIIIYTDIDLSFDLSRLKEILPLTSEFNIIKGIRLGGRESLLRTIYSKTYNFLINLIFGLNLKDVNFVKIFKRDLINQLKLKSEGSFINVELLAKARKLNCSIKEVELEYRPRTYGISRLCGLRVIFKIVYELIKYYPEIRFFPKKESDYSKLEKLYEKTDFKAKVYNFIRFKTCPYAEIKRFIPREGDIVDLGCGTGLMINLLRLEQRKNKFFGFDKDVRKIKVAQDSSKVYKDIIFEIADISSESFCLPKTKCAILIDVLYFLDFNQKIQLLNKCFKALDPDGILIIKDQNKFLNWKFFWVFMHDFLCTKVFNLTICKGLHYENQRNYTLLLKREGFETEIFDISKGYFYPHILYVCKKQ